MSLMTSSEERDDASGLFDISGKIALVTGGSRGIGLMIARTFIGCGMKVYISSRDESACEEAARDLSPEGSCLALPSDLRSEGGCQSLIERVADFEGALHVLVNNAGSAWSAPLDTFDEDAWERDLSLNLKAVFHLSKFARPLLRSAASANDPARIINVGSVDGLRPPHHQNFAYSASKAGVHQLTRQLAQNLGPEILVNAIAPGPFETKMLAPVLVRQRHQVCEETVLGRLGEPREIGGAAAFLASRASTYITGAVLPVDGGLLVR
jgi:NAD(P)-dependent dehydrogenase (short-subunit alcohol dehydrogenase family)